MTGKKYRISKKNKYYRKTSLSFITVCLCACTHAYAHALVCMHVGGGCMDGYVHACACFTRCVCFTTSTSNVIVCSEPTLSSYMDISFNGAFFLLFFFFFLLFQIISTSNKNFIHVLHVKTMQKSILKRYRGGVRGGGVVHTKSQFSACSIVLLTLTLLVMDETLF